MSKLNSLIFVRRLLEQCLCFYYVVFTVIEIISQITDSKSE